MNNRSAFFLRLHKLTTFTDEVTKMWKYNQPQKIIWNKYLTNVYVIFEIVARSKVAVRHFAEISKYE